MDRSRIETALSLLGVSSDASAVYVAMLDLGPVTRQEVAGELAQSAGLPADRHDTAYDELARSGLVSSASDPDSMAAPLPPAAALEILGRHRAAELDESRITVSGAFEEFRRHKLAEYNHNLVEVVTGEAIGQRMRQAWRSARHEIRQLDSPPYFDVEGGVGDALDSLGRGVVQRVVYSRDSLTHPGKLSDDIAICVAAGEQARVVAETPVKLIIIDDSYALVSLSIREAEVFNTMLIVQPCGLFSALVALFEHSWSVALPFHDRESQSQRLTPSESRLLSLLAAGVGDDVIARELRMSRRTLYRRIEVLAARLGASTRFQMALHAQRRGWL
jgi:DNA-binding CsgD family transcriptional regulator